MIPLPGQATTLELDAAAINPRDVDLKHLSLKNRGGIPRAIQHKKKKTLQ